MKKDSFTLMGGDANILVCNCFSDAYPKLNNYIKTEGIKTESRLGPTYETLNFKTVINEPIKRCTISRNRRSNIFFHLAESLWVLAGRNDLRFIQIFNSKFEEFSDDGKTLHGGYGARIRNWSSSGEASSLDQLLNITSLLNSDPDLRRSVISLWNPSIDLGKPSKDVPCNTQLVLRIKKEELYLTIFNRSNDLHWGYIANIFQFSILGEIISLLLNKKFVQQTHFSQSLHIYTDNNLINKVIDTDIHVKFYAKYYTAPISFNFNNSTSVFVERFKEIDEAIKSIVETILDCNDETVESGLKYFRGIEGLRSKSPSFYEIAFLLILYVRYKKELNGVVEEEARKKIQMEYAEQLILKNKLDKFKHGDYFAMALNYFVTKLDKSTKLKLQIEDFEMGHY